MTADPKPGPRPAVADEAPRTYSLTDAVGLGRERLAAGDLLAADAILRQVLKAAPDHLEALSLLADVFERQGRGRGPRAALDVARAARGQSPDFLFALGNTLRAFGLYDQAIVVYRRATELRSEFAEAFCNLGLTLRELGWFDEAVTALKAAATARPDLGTAWLNLGLAFKERGEPEAAVEAYSRAIVVDPRVASAHANLGIALRDLGRKEDALAAYRAAIAADPGFAPAHYNLGNLLDALGKTDEALACQECAIAADPTLSQPYAKIGGIRLRRRDAAGALEICDTYLERHGANAGVFACKIAALEELGRGAEARRIADPKRLVRSYRLPATAAFESSAAFNAALEAHVTAHPTLKYSPPQHATRYGMHSGELLAGERGPVAVLQDLVTDAVQDYLDTMTGDGGNLFLSKRPSLSRMSAWAVIMERQGHQVAHIHPTAWLSGVYYVRLPRAVSQPGNDFPGWIEFGDTAEEYGQRHCRPPTEVFRPEEGGLFLFPSYLYHRTIPFATPEKRICIAFDIW